MLIYLHGSDSFRQSEAVKKFKDKFLRDVDASGVNITTLSGGGLTIGDVRTAITAGGFLATKRLLIFRDVIRDNAGKTFQQELVEALKGEQGAQDNLLVFWETDDVLTNTRKRSPKKTERVAAYLEKHADHTYAFPQLTGVKLTAWITKRFAERGGTAPSPVVTALADRIGSDLWRQANEIDKLISYAEGRAVTPADVDAFVPLPYDQNVFHLLDAVGDQNAQASLKHLMDLRASGENEFSLLSQLVRQTRILLQLVDLKERGKQGSAKELGVHPFVFTKSSRQAQRFTFPQMRNMHEQLLEADLRLKNSPPDPEAVLTKLVLSLCTTKKARR